MMLLKRCIYAMIKNIEDKTPDITILFTKTTLNAINDVKWEISSITNLATATALTVVESKMPNVINLVRKTDYNTKINETEKKITDHNLDKYITTLEFNKLTAQKFAAALTHANLLTNTDFNYELINFNYKIWPKQKNRYTCWK